METNILTVLQNAFTETNILFTEAARIARLAKCIYEDRHLFTKTTMIIHLIKSIYRGGRKITVFQNQLTDSKNGAPFSLILHFHVYIRHLGFLRLIHLSLSLARSLTCAEQSHHLSSARTKHADRGVAQAEELAGWLCSLSRADLAAGWCMLAQISRRVDGGQRALGQISRWAGSGRCGSHGSRIGPRGGAHVGRCGAPPRQHNRGSSDSQSYGGGGRALQRYVSHPLSLSSLSTSLTLSLVSHQICWWWRPLRAQQRQSRSGRFL